jgi:hypothetical protein
MTSRLGPAALVALLIVGLLPGKALAADPVAHDDEYTVGVNATATSLDVLLNDTDADIGDTPTITNVTDPANGTVVNNGDGIDYTPDADFHAIDTFDYTIEDPSHATSTATVTVIVNDPPLALDDPGSACSGPNDFGGGFPIPEDFVGTMAPTDYFAFFGNCALLFNDMDPNGDALTWEIVDQPSNGDVIKFDEEFFGYRPVHDYGTVAGSVPGHAWSFDTLTYRACDGLSCSEPASMRFWVAQVDDPPTFTAGPSIVTVTEDSGQYSGAWATDVSPGPGEPDQTVDFQLDGPAQLQEFSNRELFIVPPDITADGTLTFTLEPDAYGYAQVTMVAKDDGFDADTCSYLQPPTPACDDTTDQFTFQIAVTSVNDAPVAVDDTATVPRNAAATAVDVLANDDDDVDGETPTITARTDGSKGTVVITGGGTGLTYQPGLNQIGSDSFTYTISDGSLATATATVSVTIAGGNVAPSAVDEPFTVGEDAGATAVPVLANDWDAESDPLLITGKTNGAKGTVTITGGGSGLTYAPNLNANGSDSFTYTIDDGQGGTDTGTVSITITPVNDLPVANNDSATVTEDALSATAIAALGNDTDADGDTRTVTGKTNGAKGVVTITGGGTGVAYKPSANLNGADSFTYTISDGHGGTAIGTVNVTITPVNDIPNAVNDAGLTVWQSAGPTALAVGTNDSDVDGDTLSITFAGPATHGAVAITGGGTGLTFDPVQLYAGTDTFTYTVSDGHGGTDTATVLLTVVNDSSVPTVTSPVESFYGQTVATSTVNANLRWSGSDTGSGIATYQLQVSVDSGAYTAIALASPTTTSINRSLTSGRTYRYRVRAIDGQGNASAYAYGSPLTPVRYENTSSSVTYVGSWTAASTPSALGGSHRYSSSAAARVSITQNVRDFAWVATRTRTSGSAQVWIDGVLTATINTRWATTKYRQLIFAHRFSTLGTHTIEIRPLGGRLVYFDAFLALR